METADYSITIKTSEFYAKGGTDDQLSIQLVNGAGKMSEWKALDNILRNDFEKGSTCTFDVTIANVGLPVLVRMRLDHEENKADLWYCENIEVTYGESTEQFPVYDWVTDQIEVTAGKALIPQKVEHAVIRDSRQREITQSKDKFKWFEKKEQADWKTTRFLATDSHENLPRFFKQKDARKRFLDDTASIVKMNFVLQKIKGFFIGIKDLNDYRNLFTHWKIPGKLPPYIELWQQDAEMGRQMLNGTNPGEIRRCKKLPEYCNVNNEHVQNLLNPGKTLESEISAGRVYIIDHSIYTTEVRRNKMQNTEEPMHSPNSIGLFYSSGDGRLMPIAIQLEPNDPDTIFTSSDEKFDWLLAKMYFRTADGGTHEWIYHFLRTHAALEPIAVALFRCMPKSHPVYKLLRPHLETIPGANQIARDDLLPESSPVNFTMATPGKDQVEKGFETFDFGDLSLPNKLRSNGVLDRELLPNYYYRDDGMLLWGAIVDFITKVIKFYYKSTEDIENDHELQSWIGEVAMEGYGWMDDNTRGCPDSFHTIEELIQFCTTVVFTSSAQHAAVNFPQFDIYKFIPNSPMAMRLPIHKRGEGSMQRVLDSLPNIDMAALQIGNVFALSNFSPVEVFIGEFPKKLFTEPEVIGIMEEFALNLKEVESKIAQRNGTIQFPYEYLLPSRVPSSIAI